MAAVSLVIRASEPPPGPDRVKTLFASKTSFYILSCCHVKKITNSTSQRLAPKKNEKSAICKDIKLKFGMETKFGPLSSKRNINLQFDVINPILDRVFGHPILDGGGGQKAPHFNFE